MEHDWVNFGIGLISLAMAALVIIRPSLYIPLLVIIVALYAGYVITSMVNNIKINKSDITKLKIDKTFQEKLVSIEAELMSLRRK